MSNTTQYSSVKEYLNDQSEEVRSALLILKSLILNVEPSATELMNYNIPAYALIKGGKREEQIMIAGYKKHVGFYPHPTTIIHFKDELKDYKCGKGSVQFPINKPLPEELITRMIEYRYSLLKNKTM